jgi:hypothetical protein
VTEYDNTNRGVLFRAKERKSDKHPEYSGSVNIEGVEYWLDGWVKDGKSGKFFSLSVKPKDAAKVERFKTAVAEAFPPRGRPTGLSEKPRFTSDPHDDEIPF